MTPWDRARPLIERAIARQDTHSIDDVKRSLDAGEAQLWCGTGSAMITGLWAYPRSKSCIVWLAAGDKNELVGEMLPAVEEWALGEGCTAVEIKGRPGWERELSGYRRSYVVIKKEIGS